MRRVAALLALLLLATCAPKPVPPPPIAATPPAPVAPISVCQLAANGGPILGDRGIGGTGLSADEERLVERGIGGTGIGTQIPPSVVRGLTENRGAGRRPKDERTGDAGIVGVITGFGSICIDGNEVGLDGSVPMRIDGNTAPGTALRAGQVAVIDAAIDDGGLRSLLLSVRHEIAGPIERRGASDGTMIVAGQTVAVPASIEGAGTFAPGDWVRVSGLRRPDGSIVATRLDPMPNGLVSLSGRVEDEHGKLRIGQTTLVPPPGVRVSAGMFVTVSGHYAAGTLRADMLEHDLLAQDPIAYFGSAARRIIEHTIVRIETGRVLLNSNVAVPLAADVSVPNGDAVNAVITMERGADGAFTVTKVDVVTPNR